MLRKIVRIDESKCNGCGLCASACHEGAIKMINGKAKLVRDDYCDGLGDCLPACPQDAITIEEREATPYSEQAVAAARQASGQQRRNVAQANGSTRPQGGDVAVAVAERPETPQASQHQAEGGQHEHEHHGGCPGSRPRFVEQVELPTTGNAISQLTNWPVQLKLAPTKSRFFDGANLLVSADCCAYACAQFHEQYMRNRTVVIGCPKLDDVDYTEKLTEIIRDNDIKSLTICRMEVPCCGGLQRMATDALKASGKFIPWQVVTFGIDGRVVED